MLRLAIKTDFTSNHADITYTSKQKSYKNKGMPIYKFQHKAKIRQIVLLLSDVLLARR